MPETAPTPQALSLRWKAFLVLLAVLAVVHGGLAYNGYIQLKEQFADRITDDFSRYRSALEALFRETERTAIENGRIVAAVAPVEDLSWVGELFFRFSSVRYYDLSGGLLASWHWSGAQLDPAQAQIERQRVLEVARTKRAASYVECSRVCTLHALVPAYEQRQREIVVAVADPLDDDLAQFQSSAGADVALVAQPSGSSAPPALWGESIVALTNEAGLRPLIDPHATGAVPAIGQIVPIESHGRALRISRERLSIPSVPEVEAVLIADPTDRLQRARDSLVNYLAVAGFAVLIATAAIFVLLTPVLRRLRYIADGLPFVAAQKFAEARNAFLQAGRGTGARDEIDGLSASIVAMTNRLEQLMGAEAAAEAKSQFLASMSHEIRTPINGLLGLLELHEQSPLSDEQRESVRIMRDSAVTLLKVIDDILDFSKMEAGAVAIDPVAMPLRDAFEGALSTLAASAATRGLRVVCFVQPGLPEKVLADPVRLRQVVLNLCANAIKFTEKGTVTLRVTSPDPLARPLTLRCSVRDTGIGISPEVQSRLFKPFSQAEASTSRRFGGTGLGLSIARGLVQRMGGMLDLISAPGHGSEFWFEIPCGVVEGPAPAPELLDGIGGAVEVADVLEREGLVAYLTSAGAVLATPDAADVVIAEEGCAGLLLTSRRGGTLSLGRPVRYRSLLAGVARLCGRVRPEAEPAAPAAPVARERLGRERLGRILVAEDHPTNRRVILHQLQRLGYEPDIVENGSEALERIARARYDALITDVHMPGMDGIELTRLIRVREAAGTGTPLPIIGLTADVLPTAIEHCRQAGMTEVLRKPLSVAELGSALARRVKPVSTAAVDRARLAEILGTDEPRVIQEMLAEFAATSRGHAGALAGAVARGDTDSARRIAHQLSGSSRTIGATTLPQAAADLESACAAGSEDIAALHGVLAYELERVLADIAAATP